MLEISKVKPMFTSILTTGDKFLEDVKLNGIITDKKGDLKLYQKVVAVGSAVRDIKEGDMVMINPASYTVRKYDKNSLQNDLDNNPIVSINIPTVPIINEDGETVEHLLINDRDVLFVFEGKEVSRVISVPGKPKILIN